MTDHQARLITLGEALAVLSVPEGDTSALAQTLRFGIGGAELNVAIGFSRLGGRSTYVGRVGADMFGDRIARELMAEGVRAELKFDPLARTGLALKEQLPAGRTRVSYRRSSSAGRNLSRVDLSGAFDEDYSVLHVTGITSAISESAHDAVLHAIDLAQSRGVKVSFDVNHRASLWRGDTAKACAAYREIAAKSSILFGNAQELQLLSDGLAPFSPAVVRQAYGVDELVLKRGAAGAVAYSSVGEAEVSAFPANVVDTVGAGDAFAAGYLAERLAGETIPTAMATAARVAAVTCENRGDWEGIPSREILSSLDSIDEVLR